MNERNLIIKDILIKGSYATPEDMQKAEEWSDKTNGLLEEYFFNEGLINKDLFGQAVAEYYGILYADLNSNIPTPEQVQRINEDVARQYRVVLYSESGPEVVVATDNPWQPDLASVLKSVFPTQRVNIAYSLTEDIDANFVHYRKTLETRFNEILQAKKKVAPEIIEQIISDALGYRSSDIHFEPQPEEVIIRFRIDGVLTEAGRIKKDNYDNILNLIKVRANLRIDEHASAQDGAIRMSHEGNQVDIRVSLVPTLGGEKVVFRLLSTYVRGFTLSDLGLSEEDRDIFTQSAHKPFGMILVTGPTGSGKSTTLYSLLKILNNPGVNITTIEDPVEYKVDNANQIQVNAATNLTFARGLRSIVRQDPDIILVGEIRDAETAEISVNAALTGHLLLSTFHANDSATAVPRLFDMGIEPFLLASTLELIVAQRLVRKICEKCRYSYTGDLMGEKTVLYKGKGCTSCNHTGYKGRVAIFEFIRMTPNMKQLILKNPSAPEIWELAKKEGSHSFFYDGLNKVRTGITTIDDLKRVAPTE
ncbi:MAG: GspE/PulE family protein [Patescibacteria group bacterium]|jgi:type IV pilus assembly protein PilB